MINLYYRPTELFFSPLAAFYSPFMSTGNIQFSSNLRKNAKTNAFLLANFYYTFLLATYIYIGLF